MKKYLKLITIIFLCLAILTPSFAFASDGINTDNFKNIYNTNGTTEVTKAGGQVVRIIQIIGIIVSVGALIIIGIKYITSSPNEKAETKHQLMAYAIGAVLIFAGSAFLKVIADFVGNLGK